MQKQAQKGFRLNFVLVERDMLLKRDIAFEEVSLLFYLMILKVILRRDN